MSEKTAVRALVLGIAQDGGVPQAGCACPRCRAARAGDGPRLTPACLGLVDPEHGRFLIDATPALPGQLDRLLLEDCAAERDLSGVLLTHAHTGHYTGLIHLGREMRAEHALPLHATPRMCSFLESNAPWSELVRNENVAFRPLEPGATVDLTPNLRVTAWAVPHRDELSDTVAFLVEGPTKRLLWLPDINAWDAWERPLEEVLDEVDLAFLDATFWSALELPGRDLAEIPHPLAEETVRRSAGRRAEVRLVHLNHSNPLLGPEPEPRGSVEAQGVTLAVEGESFEL